MAKFVTLKDEQIRAAIVKAKENDGAIDSLELTTVSAGPFCTIIYKKPDGVESVEEHIEQTLIISYIASYLRGLGFTVADRPSTQYKPVDDGHWTARIEVQTLPKLEK